MAASIKVTLELDDKGYLTGIKAAQAETTALGTKAKAAGVAGAEGFSVLAAGAKVAQAAVATLMAELAPLLAIGAAISAVASAFRFADDITDLADASGVATETIMGLQASLAAAGGNADDAGKMIQKLTNSLQDARNGSTEAYDKLDKLGLSLKDIQNLTPDEALRKTIEKLAAMQDPVQRNALAFDLLGRSAANINWAQVSEGLGTTTEEQKRAAAEAEKLGQFMDDMGKAFYAVKLALVEFLGPIVDVIKKFSEFSGIATILKGVIAVLRVAIGAIAGVFVILAADIEVAASAFVALYEAMGNVVKGDFSAAKKNLTDYGAHAKKVLADADASVQQLMGVGGGNEPSPAAKPQTADADAKKASGDKASELTRKLGSLREEILKNAESFRIANQQTRDKIALDTELMGVSDAEKRIRTEQTAIDDRAAAAIKNLNDQKKQLGNTATDQAKAGAINETIRLIQKQAEVDKAATATVISENEKKKKSFEDAAAAIAISLGGEKFRAGLDRELLLMHTYNDAERRALQERFKIEDEYQADIQTARQKYIALETATAEQRAAVNAALAEAEVRAEQKRQQKLGELAKSNPKIEQTVKELQAVEEARKALNDQTGLNEYVQNLRDEISIALAGSNDRAAIRKLEIDSEKKYREDLAALRVKYAAEKNLDENKDYQDEVARAEARAAARKASIEQSSEEIKQLMSKNDFVSFFGDAKNALTDFILTGQNGFKSLAQSLLRTFTKRLIDQTFDPLINGLADAFSKMNIGGGISSIFGSIVGSIFGGGRATGGPVMPGKSYLVGENGPEMLTMGASGGYVTPNSQLGSAGKAVNINYNINAVDAPSFRALVAREPEFIYAVTEKGRQSVPYRR